MQMFILPSAIESQLLRHDVEFMAAGRQPSVTIQFKDPDFRFYLSLKELFKLRRDHRLDDGSHSEYAITGGFEFEPGDRIKGRIHGAGHVPATIIKVAVRDGFGTSYEVDPDIPPATTLPGSKWRSWRGRLRPAPQPGPVIWPGEDTYYLRPATSTHLIDLEHIEQG